MVKVMFARKPPPCPSGRTVSQFGPSKFQLTGQMHLRVKVLTPVVSLVSTMLAH